MKKITYLFFFLFFTLPNSYGQDNEDLYNLDQVHEIRLEFDRDNWSGVMDSLRLYGDDLLNGGGGQNEMKGLVGDMIKRAPSKPATSDCVLSDME